MVSVYLSVVVLLVTAELLQSFPRLMENLAKKHETGVQWVVATSSRIPSLIILVSHQSA